MDIGDTQHLPNSLDVHRNQPLPSPRAMALPYRVQNIPIATAFGILWTPGFRAVSPNPPGGSTKCHT